MVTISKIDIFYIDFQSIILSYPSKYSTNQSKLNLKFYKTA